MRYAVVIEKGNGNYSAYVPDLPGCIATGDTVCGRGKRNSRGDTLHIDGLQPMGSWFPNRPASRNMSRHKQGGLPHSLPQSSAKI